MIAVSVWNSLYIHKSLPLIPVVMNTHDLSVQNKQITLTSHSSQYCWLETMATFISDGWQRMKEEDKEKESEEWEHESDLVFVCSWFVFRSSLLPGARILRHSSVDLLNEGLHNWSERFKLIRCSSEVKFNPYDVAIKGKQPAAPSCPLFPWRPHRTYP